MKDIHEVKDNQPLSFNHVHCRGVAARAESVNTLNGPEAGQEGKGKNTPTTAPSCSSKRFILQEISTNHRKPTRSPQTMPIIQHSLAHNDVDDIPPYNHATHFLRGCSKFTFTQSTTFHTLKASPSATVPAIPPGSSTSLTD